MEDWEFDFEWLRVRHLVKTQTGKDSLPDLNGILFLIGIQELGRWKDNFTKEEKQDLMHIAVCRLLSYEEHYEFVGRDEDGWPHWKEVKPLEVKGVTVQERLLQEKVIQYFNDLQKEWGALSANDEEE